MVLYYFSVSQTWRMLSKRADTGLLKGALNLTFTLFLMNLKKYSNFFARENAYNTRFLVSFYTSDINYKRKL